MHRSAGKAWSVFTVALYAASPLFNGNTEYYSDFVNTDAVSYTHLDVYKRQAVKSLNTMHHDSMSVNFVRFVHTFPLPDVYKRQKVYLLALDSIFVPSMYSTFSLMKPLEERRSTVGGNTSLISFFTRLRKRLMVMKSGFSYPASQI